MSNKSRDGNLLLIAQLVLAAGPEKLHTVKHTEFEIKRAIAFGIARFQQIGEEMGQGRCAEQASTSLPSPSPSSTGEQEGHFPGAEKANDTLPPASPAPLDDEGQIGNASDGLRRHAPSSSPNKAGEGHSMTARQSQRACAPPALVPTAKQRSAAARAMERTAPTAVAKTILDTWKLRGGISIGDARYVALEQIQLSSELEVAVIQNIRDYGIPDNRSMRVRDYLTAAQVMKAIKDAERRFHNVSAA